MNSRLNSYIKSITNKVLSDACRHILSDKKFEIYPASLSHHHAYVGGLINHTLEVCDYAVGIARVMDVNTDILIAASLLHDFMKIEEYVLVDNLPEKQRGLDTDIGFFIRSCKDVKTYGLSSHIIRGAIEFEKIINGGCFIDEEIKQEVSHCILSHHGPVKEWGSPVAPATIEALILHQADMLSAGYGETR